jgi:hypothetical protein
MYDVISRGECLETVNEMSVNDMRYMMHSRPWSSQFSYRCSVCKLRCFCIDTA